MAKTPIRHDSANAGIFSLAFSDALHGIAVGGDYMKPDESAGNIAITTDGGKNVDRGSRCHRLPIGCLVPRFEYCVATGTSGSDYSSDGGQSWKSFGSEGYNAIGAFAWDPTAASLL